MAIAMLLALPLSYFAMDGLLGSIYVYHVRIAVFPFAIATILVFITTMLVTSLQVRRAVVANPVDSLRSE